MTSTRLERTFFERPTLTVAREILGKKLVRMDSEARLSGLVTEAEAYIGTDDLGCHARAGKTPRNRTMWGPAGFAYVYFTYGMHWMLNFVTEREGFPAAVLIRAILPVEGMSTISQRRSGVPWKHQTDGPAKLTRALGIDRSLDGADLCTNGSGLFVEEGPSLPDEVIRRGPRIGLNNVPEPWKSIDWRFWVPFRDLPTAEPVPSQPCHILE